MPKTTYIWDELSDNVIAEYEDGVLSASYTHEPGLYGNLVSQNRSGVTRYYHYDGRGDTVALTDDAGNVTDTKDYDAWGNVIASTGSTVTPYQFIGRQGYQSGITGVYVRARMYQPTIARWQSTDPLFFAEVFNLYLYARNSPNRRRDASGFLSAPISFDNPTPWLFDDEGSSSRLPCKDQIYWDYDSCDENRGGQNIAKDCRCQCNKTHYNTIEFGEFYQPDMEAFAHHVKALLGIGSNCNVKIVFNRNCLQADPVPPGGPWAVTCDYGKESTDSLICIPTVGSNDFGKCLMRELVIHELIHAKQLCEGSWWRMTGTEREAEAYKTQCRERGMQKCFKGRALENYVENVCPLKPGNSLQPGMNQIRANTCKFWKDLVSKGG